MYLSFYIGETRSERRTVSLNLEKKPLKIVGKLND